GPVTIERPAVFPGCLDDARHTIGESHSGDVVTALTLARQGPLPQTIKWTAGALLAMGGHQRRARTVHQQGTQVDVATLGDMAEPRLASGGVLARHQAQPSRELAAIPEVMSVTHRRYHCRGGDGTNSRASMRTTCQFVVSNIHADLAFVLERLAAQSLGMLEQIPHAARNLRRQSINQLRHLATKLLNTIRQDVAELGDQSANAIEG